MSCQGLFLVYGSGHSVKNKPMIQSNGKWLASQSLQCLSLGCWKWPNTLCRVPVWHAGFTQAWGQLMTATNVDLLFTGFLPFAFLAHRHERAMKYYFAKKGAISWLPPWERRRAPFRQNIGVHANDAFPPLPLEPLLATALILPSYNCYPSCCLGDGRCIFSIISPKSHDPTFFLKWDSVSKPHWEGS